jgi:ribosome-associated protein
MMITVKIRDEYIKLGQAMKLAGFVDSGAEAKEVIEEGKVTVAGEVETRRGKKLRNGDTFAYDGKEAEISAPAATTETK